MRDLKDWSLGKKGKASVGEKFESLGFLDTKEWTDRKVTYFTYTILQYLQYIITIVQFSTVTYNIF